MSAFTNVSKENRGGIAQALATFGNAARPALPLLLAESKNPYFDLRLHASIAVRTIAPDITNALAAPIRDLSSPEGGVRQRTLWALRNLGTNAVDALPALIHCLSHPDGQTQLDAQTCIEQMGMFSDEVLANLSTNALGGNRFVAGNAVDILARQARHSHAAFAALLKVVKPSGNEAQEQAKYKLIDLARQDPKFVLLSLEDPEATLRQQALAVLYDLAVTVPDSVPILVRLLNDTHAPVRAFAGKVLHRQAPDVAKAHGVPDQ